MPPYNLNSKKPMFGQFRKGISIVILVAFVATSIKSPGFAQMVDPMPRMPAPGIMVHLSPDFTPAELKGIVIHPDNAFKFDFIVYKGDKPFTGSQKTQEYTKLIKYFLASLAVPDEDQWVNLSPYEKDRIIKDNFGKTEMGRDLLAQDYLLKQITASLIYPQDKIGQKFWSEIYEKAFKQYGTTNIPVNTFNKVWILPDDADIFEKGNIAYLYHSHLKVMLEEDYLSLQKHSGIETSPSLDPNKAHSIASQVVRSVVLPELEKEVNEGKNFAPLRQVVSGMILAAWYKRALRQSILAKIYANKSRVKGVDQNPQNNEVIYRQYLKAFKKGVFNYIQEDEDRYTNQSIPRKYFSGGLRADWDGAMTGTPALHRYGPGDTGAASAAMRSYKNNGNKMDLVQAVVSNEQDVDLSRFPSSSVFHYRQEDAGTNDEWMSEQQKKEFRNQREIEALYSRAMTTNELRRVSYSFRLYFYKDLGRISNGVTGQYFYDSQNRYIGRSSNGSAGQYFYDAEDKYLGKSTNWSTGQTFYDANDRIIGRSENGTTGKYFYDANKNLIGRSDNGATGQYFYDADGHSIGKSLNGETGQYFTFYIKQEEKAPSTNQVTAAEELKDNAMTTVNFDSELIRKGDLKDSYVVDLPNLVEKGYTERTVYIENKEPGVLVISKLKEKIWASMANSGNNNSTFFANNFRDDKVVVIKGAINVTVGADTLIINRKNDKIIISLDGIYRFDQTITQSIHTVLEHLKYVFKTNNIPFPEVLNDSKNMSGAQILMALETAEKAPQNEELARQIIEAADIIDAVMNLEATTLGEVPEVFQMTPNEEMLLSPLNPAYRKLSSELINLNRKYSDYERFYLEVQRTIDQVEDPALRDAMKKHMARIEIFSHDGRGGISYGFQSMHGIIFFVSDKEIEDEGLSRLVTLRKPFIYEQKKFVQRGVIAQGNWVRTKMADLAPDALAVFYDKSLTPLVDALRSKNFASSFNEETWKAYQDYKNGNTDVEALVSRPGVNKETLLLLQAVDTMVQTIKAELEKNFTPTERIAFAKLVHNNGYYLAEYNRTKNPHDQLLPVVKGGSLNGNGAELLTADARKRYDARVGVTGKASLVKLSLADFDLTTPEARQSVLAYFESQGKDINTPLKNIDPKKDGVGISLTEAINSGDQNLLQNVNVFNGFVQSWDGLLGEFKGDEEKLKAQESFVYGKQIDAVAGTLVLLSIEKLFKQYLLSQTNPETEPAFLDTMNRATNAVWRATNPWESWSSPLIHNAYEDISLDQKLKDEHIWAAVITQFRLTLFRMTPAEITDLTSQMRTLFQFLYNAEGKKETTIINQEPLDFYKRMKRQGYVFVGTVTSSGLGIAQEDIATAKEAIKKVLRNIAESEGVPIGKIILVSGATGNEEPGNLSGVELSYLAAEEAGALTMGIATMKAFGFPIKNDLKYLLIRGLDWGNESSDLINFADHMIGFTGGNQAATEMGNYINAQRGPVHLIRNIHSFVPNMKKTGTTTGTLDAPEVRQMVEAIAPKGSEVIDAAMTHAGDSAMKTNAIPAVANEFAKGYFEALAKAKSNQWANGINNPGDVVVAYGTGISRVERIAMNQLKKQLREKAGSSISSRMIDQILSRTSLSIRISSNIHDDTVYIFDFKYNDKIESTTPTTGIRAKVLSVIDKIRASIARDGGIDLNSVNLNMHIKRDGNGVPLPLSQQNLENIKIDGLIPRILGIRPAMNSPLLSQLQ